MMETATMRSSPLDSKSSSSKSVSPQRDPRTPRFSVDVFHSPFEFSSHRNHGGCSSTSYSPRSQPAIEDTTVSPTGMPISFDALRESAHGLSLRIGRSLENSPSFTPSFPLNMFRATLDRNPSLTIRRAPGGVSLSKELDSFGLDGYSPPKESGRRNHRRRRTGSLSDSLPHHDTQDYDMIFPANVEDIHLCDEDHCSNHHHRQSSSSTVSIKCDKSDDEGESTNGMNHIEGEIETSIPMAPMAPLILVPLIDRPVEMAELLDHRANKRWVNMLKHSVSDDKYKNQCLPLWTETSRSRCPDISWLKRSKDLLISNSCGGNKDMRLWSEFCDMVGWSERSENDIDLDGYDSHKPPSVSPRRKSSQDGCGSPQMKCIVEEED